MLTAVRPLLASCLMASLVVSCRSETSSRRPEVTRLAGIPVLEGATRGPGTELDAGIEVAEGSHLLGAVFPAGDDDREDRGWMAVLLLTGDAREVLSQYTAQSEAVGLPLRPSGSACDVLRDVFKCDVSSQQGTREEGRSLRVRLWRAPGAAAQPPMSHVVIDYSERGRPPYPPADARGHRQIGATPPLPEEWPPLPGTGKPYHSDPGREPLRVEEGSILLTHPSASMTCSPGGGSSAMFLVIGEPEKVIDGYVEQQPGDVTRRVTAHDGVTEHSATWTNGWSYDARAFVRDGEPTYLLVHTCGVD